MYSVNQTQYIMYYTIYILSYQLLESIAFVIFSLEYLLNSNDNNHKHYVTPPQ